MPREHLLSGLEPDNLLGFLALLGFHRCVSHARPDWNARVYWDGVPLRPSVVFSKDVNRHELLEQVSQGANELAKVHSFDRPNLDYPPEEARILLVEALGMTERFRGDLLTSLMSDVAARDGKVRSTPLCAMFGQGHQSFLDRLDNVPKGIPPKVLKEEITAEDLNSPAKLEEALFQEWDRRDQTQSFRWDPLEDRRYALRFDDPSGDKCLTVHGANRLAALALPLLTAVPMRERGEVRLYALGTAWEDGSLVVRWPIWSLPATLRAVRMMVAGCGIEDNFGGLGLKYISRSRRISVGKFFNFTRAIPERNIRNT